MLRDKISIKRRANYIKFEYQNILGMVKVNIQVKKSIEGPLYSINPNVIQKMLL